MSEQVHRSESTQRALVVCACEVLADSEEEKADFPNSLWMVTGNDEANDIRRESIMAKITGEAT